MEKLFSMASWNVEHFRDDPARAARAVAFIKEVDPDLFGIFEVEGRAVFEHFVDLMPTHNFFITEDFSRIEILVGVRRDFTAFVTQRERFKSRDPALRPGALATLSIAGEIYSVLFLHVKSSTEPRSWGLRDDMIGHVSGLKRALDRRASDPDVGANLVCMGDLNTMGLNVTYSDKDMSGGEELRRYARRLAGRRLRLLRKTRDVTWWGGGSLAASDLDHAFASRHLTFQPFGAAEVVVRGWPELDGDAQRRAWIEDYSDHGLIYAELVTA